MSSKLLVINADGPETRVALVEGGIVKEFYVERDRDRGIVGNVYKGRVRRVLKGMQAAFVDIGLPKDAYLHARDVRGSADDIAGLLVDEEEGREEEEERPGRTPIRELLKEGQDILVQAAKDRIGTKGARLTTYITLPGRHLVFMPTIEHVGISRRIASDRERRRLRKIVDKQRPPGTGFIVRTVAEDVPASVLEDDIQYLIRLWNEKIGRAENTKAPACVYWDLDLPLRSLRDLATSDVAKIIIDSPHVHERLTKFSETFMPHQKWRIEHYQGEESIFDAYGIEEELARALERKVWLKSGSYLLMDQMEALTAIDVNTGRFVGRKNLEDTITKTNLEAVGEVVDQIRLRNLGGIVVVDFIDMEKRSNRNKVYRAFVAALKEDRARATALPISDFGLIEMTRKRVRESLSRSLTERCSQCDGKGTVKSRLTTCYDALREVRRRAETIEGKLVVIAAHPEVARIIEKEESEYVAHLEKRLSKRIEVRAEASFHLEQFEVRGR